MSHSNTRLFAVLAALVSWGTVRADVAIAPDPPAKRPGQTAVLMTLDDPLPAKGSAVWCASFESAWSKVRELNGGEPVEIQGAEEASRRLNKPMPALSLDPASHFAAAGSVKKGIVDEIRKEMKKRFPMATLGPLEAVSSADYVAYAYLRAGIEFPAPYAEGTANFTDAEGKKTVVQGFGYWPKLTDPKAIAASRQLRILFYDSVRVDAADQFAADLHAASKPYQIVAACIPRQRTLQAAVDLVSKRIAKTKGSGEQLYGEDMVFVPSMDWRFEHEFSELTNRPITAGTLKGGSLLRAIQSTAFTLNKNGAVMESRAQTDVRKSIPPRRLLFDQPFLLTITQRESGRPILAMWVDNAELLVRK
jgi:hypothetical protein